MMLAWACAAAYAEGLSSLVEVGSSMDDAKKTLDAETRGFENVKRALDAGAIQKGAAKESIRAQYGQPVIVTKDGLGGKEKWVYKPASSSFFKGARICLYFNDLGTLDEVKVVE